MSKQKISFFSSKKKNGWIFGLVVVFFLLVAIQIGDYKYNAFSSWLAEKTAILLFCQKLKKINSD